MRLEVKTNNFPPWLHLDIPSAGVFPIAWDQEKLQPCFPVTMLQTLNTVRELTSAQGSSTLQLSHQ